MVGAGSGAGAASKIFTWSQSRSHINVMRLRSQSLKFQHFPFIDYNHFDDLKFSILLYCYIENIQANDASPALGFGGCGSGSYPTV
jgi:hypothetical protein